MKSGHGNNEKFSGTEYYFRKPPTTNPRIAHVSVCCTNSLGDILGTGQFGQVHRAVWLSSEQGGVGEWKWP